MRLETYKMATPILLKFQILKCDISRTVWRIEVSDGSLFCIFHALSFELNLFFDRTCPLMRIYQFSGFTPLDLTFDFELLPKMKYISQVGTDSVAEKDEKKTGRTKMIMK